MRKTAWIFVLSLVLAAAGHAQNITGSLAGRVVDPQGSAVPNAQVSVTEASKNLTVTQKTAADGTFLFAGLLPGTYSVSVEAMGFKKLSRPNIPLDANDKLAVGDLALEVGAVTESIEVTANAALLQTQSVERSATITGTQVENIEVNGRNPLDMAKLIPGVVSTANFSVGGIGGLNGLSVNGERASQNQLTINGIGDVDTGNNGQQNVVVSTDAISEFKILTGTYQAEYGRSNGAQIALVTKTGSEEFHGEGYWYHRNDSLNSNSFLNNARGLSRPLYRYNDPGYNIGGPVYIPKIFTRERHKLFFFWSQEWQRQLVPNTPRNVLVPTALERTGDFSKSIDLRGNPVTIIDPQSRSSANPNGTPFNGNVIPGPRLYAPGQALLNLYPLPNATQTSNFNYTSQLPGSAPRREDLLRMDYNVTDRVRFFGHYIADAQPNVTPYGSFVLGIQIPITTIANPTPGRSVAAGATIIISPTMTNEFNWGFTHNSILIDEAGDKLSSTTSGINLPVLYPSAVQKHYIPNVTFNSFNNGKISASPNLGTSNAPFVNYNTTIDISDNLTKVWNSHTIKAGIYMQRSRKDQTSFGAANGNYNFGDNPSNPYDSGFGLSNALLGVFNTFSQASNYINGQYRYWNIEEFVQDTWKLTPRLTFDYGLRTAWYQPQYDSSLQASTFVPSLYNPAKAPTLYQPAINPANGQRAAFDPTTGAYQPSFDIGLEIPGTGTPFQGICQAGTCVSKYLFPGSGLVFGPRFGVAWDVKGDGGLVVRAGGGMYYDRIQGNRVFDSVTNPPEAVTPTLQQNLVTALNPQNVLIGPPSLVAADPTGKVPTTYEYQVSVQSRLPWNMALDVAYVGTQARHLQNNRNLNWNQFGQCFLPQNQDPQRLASNPKALLGNNCLDANFLKPYFGFNNINLYESQSTANYNALQLNLQRRVRNGLFIGMAYTWSKSLGVAGNGISSTNDNMFVRPDRYNREANYGPTTFDRRQVLAINYVYDTPKSKYGNRFTRLVTDGWQISGVTQAMTGPPFNPGFSISGAGNQNITGSNTEPARIGVVAGCDPYTHLSDPFNRLNPSCFFAPSPGSIGLESGINYLNGPGLWNFDMALQKTFSIREKARLQFKIDAFNVFNHTNFTGYNSTLNFNAYPNTNGIVTGLPTLSSTTLGRLPNGSVNFNGFGSVTQPNPGALGYARILQTMIRFEF